MSSRWNFDFCSKFMYLFILWIVKNSINLLLASMYISQYFITAQGRSVSLDRRIFWLLVPTYLVVARGCIQMSAFLNLLLSNYNSFKLLNKQIIWFIQYLNILYILNMSDSAFLRRLNLKLFLFICVLLVYAQSQDGNSPAEMEIALNSGKNVELKAQQSLQMTAKIDRKVKEKQSLFISAQSPYNDPFEEPKISVRSDKLFSASCYDQSNDFMGICEIQSSQLTEGRTFIIQLSCEVDCKLLVSVYLSDIYSTKVGESVTLQNIQKTAVAKNILFQVPSDAVFTELMILATPTSIQQNMESTVILANYGSSPANPTSQKYMSKAQSTSAHRLGLFLSDKQVKPGDKIALFILLAPNNQIELKSSIINNNVYKLFLGEPIYDFIAGSKSRLYYIDVTQYSSQNQTFDETIKIKFISYSGYPEIRVSFDKQFSDAKKVANWNGDQAYIYDITPKIREEKGFQEFIYIEVKGDWSSNYYIGAFVDKKPFIALEPQIQELVHIQPNSLRNVIFDDSDIKIPSDGMIEYKLTMRMMQNALQFSLRQCGESKLLDCIILNPQDIKKAEVLQSFKKINYTMDQSEDVYIVKFEYNVTEHCEISDLSESTVKKYTCRFHILLQSLQNSTKESYIGIQMMKDSITDYLSEGIVQKGTVMKGEINYYAFDLPSSVNISAIEFFATVIQGDVSLLVSQTILYPTLRDLTNQKNDVIFSIFNNIVIREPLIKGGYYYIGVYGYELTDYTIGIAIQRSKKQTNTNNQTQDKSLVTQIKLQKSQAQTYTMAVNKTVSKFVFTPLTDQQVSVIRINEIQGSVQFNVTDKLDKTKSLCDSKTMRETGDNECDFKSSIYHDYLVTVTGAPDDVQLFTVLYTVKKNCNIFLWNFPLGIKLKYNEDACYFFYMNQLQDMHVSVSMSSLQILTSKLNITLEFNGQNIPINEHEKTIPKSELQILCKDKSGNRFSTSVCQFDMFIQNPESQSVEFIVAVQNYVGENVLFDRTVTTVSTDKISKEVAKHFFYYVIPGNDDNSDLCIFLTSKTNSQYRIVTKIVPNTQFVKDFDESLYPKFNQSGSNVKSIDSYEYAPIAVLNIDKEYLKSSSKFSVALISVYGYPSNYNQLQKQIYVFQIEASRGGSQLLLGDSKMGFVEKDDIYEYQITLEYNQSSSISIRQLGSKQCVKSLVYTFDSELQATPFNHIVTFSNESGKKVILVETSQEQCTYQISYNSISVPIMNILSSLSYFVQLQKGEVKYYSYYHNNPQTFIVLQMVTVGNSYLFVQPIKNDVPIEDILKKNISQFQYMSDMNGDLQISKKTTSFCSNCYYLIAVKAQKSINAEITVNPFDIPIYLMENALLRDRLEKNQLNMYQVYSKRNFNVSITLLYGKIQASVNSSNSTEMIRRTINSGETLNIEVIVSQKSDNDSYFDFWMFSSRYLITVEASEDASYYIQVRKQDLGLQAYEGVPLSLDIAASIPVTIQFKSLQEAGTMNVLVQDLKHIQNETKNELTFVVSSQSQSNLLKNVNNIESSYNIQLMAVKGVYTLKITSTKTTSLIVIFAKKQFTHLSAGRTYITDKTSIFEIFTPGSSIMIQIFACIGDVDVTASSNFTKLRDSNMNDEGLVRLEHSNYGNHYVITAENIKGEYFIQTKPENEHQATYLITYHFFNPAQGEVMPYRVYNVKNTQIFYKYTAEGVEFSLYRVMRKDGEEMEQNNVSYKFYISTNDNEIQLQTKCSLGNLTTFTQVKDSSKHGFVKFVFTSQQIKEIIKDSETYMVGAQATLFFANRSVNRISQINFVYDINQLSVNNQAQFVKQPTKQSPVMTIIIWVVLPFLIGSIFLFFAARFLLRSFSAYPTQLVEEDDGAGVSNDVLKNDKQLKMDVK